MAQTISSDDLGKDTTNNAGQQQVGIFDNQPAGAGQQNQQAGQSSQPSTPNNQKGTGFVNIGRIVQANQNNQLGNTVGQGVQQVGQQVKQNLNQSQQDFQNQTQQNQFNTGQNQQLVQNVLASPAQYQATGNNDQNSQNAAQFQRLISGQYQGPQGLQNSDQLQGQAQDVNQMNQGLSTAGGRIGLLQRFVGTPQYTAGQQGLDSLILGQTGGPALNQARQANAGVNNQIQNAVAGAQAQGQQMTDEARTFGQGVQNQFGQTVGGINSNLQQQAQQAQMGRDTSYQNALNRFRTGNITQADADLLGVSNGTSVTGDILSHPDSYLSENPDKASAQNIASSDDYARINALRQLAGGFAPTDAQNILQGYYGQDANAGKFAGEQGIVSNKDQFGKDQTAALQNYHSQIDQPLQQMNDANQIYNLSHGQVDPNLIQQAISKGGPGAQQLQLAMSQGVPTSQLGQYVIGQLYPGAMTNGTTSAGWSEGLSGSAKQAYQDALNRFNSSTGGLKSINISPEDLEKSPVVT